MNQETIRLRDDMAMSAMQGLCVNIGRNEFAIHRLEELAKSSYQIADAMMSERTQSNNEEENANTKALPKK